MKMSTNDQNNCSHLEIKNNYNESNTHLDDLLNFQAKIQQETYGTKYSEMTLSELKDFWLINTHALQDEIHEAFNALGGIHDGVGNAVWKFWKKARYESIKSKKLSDLSERDLVELKFEVIDMLHFFLNYANSIGMTAEEMYNMYVAKNKENIERQKRGY